MLLKITVDLYISKHIQYFLYYHKTDLPEQHSSNILSNLKLNKSTVYDSLVEMGLK